MNSIISGSRDCSSSWSRAVTGNSLPVTLDRAGGHGGGRRSLGEGHRSLGEGRRGQGVRELCFSGHCNDLPQQPLLYMYPITDSISPLNLKINCTSPLLNIFLWEISINSNKFLWFLSIIWSYNLWEYTVFAMILSETHETNNTSWLV